MGQKTYKSIFWAFWLMAILVGPVTAIQNTPLNTLTGQKLLQINFFQRVLGLIGFSLIFLQIGLGSLMEKLIQKIGGKAYRYHTLQGLFTYFVLLSHPLMQMLLDYNLGGFGAALLTILPGFDFYLNLGKIALYLVTLAVLASYFRTRLFFRKNWRKFHILNYVAFYLVAVHSWNVGTDIKSSPFVYYFWIAVAGVSATIAYRLITQVFPRLSKKLMLLEADSK